LKKTNKNSGTRQAEPKTFKDGKKNADKGKGVLISFRAPTDILKGRYLYHTQTSGQLKGGETLLWKKPMKKRLEKHTRQGKKKPEGKSGRI